MRTIDNVIRNMKDKGPAKCRRCGKEVPICESKVGGKVFKLASSICDDCYDAIDQERRDKDAAEKIKYIEERRAEIRANYEDFAIRAGLPPLYHSADFEVMDIDQTNLPAIEAAKRYLDDPRRFLFLCGGAGLGKTWIAAAIFRELLMRGADVQFIRAVDLLDVLRVGIQDGRSREAMDDFKRRPVLIIDDLAAERSTDWTVEQIYNLIDFRYVYNKGTVITSNSIGSELAKAFGTRVMSRITQAGDVIEIKGRDRRLK